MTLTDTHCHLDMEVFDADRDSVVHRALQQGVTRMLVPSLNLDSARRAIALAESHTTIFAAVGFHPTEIHQLAEAELIGLQRLTSHQKVKAIGEIGLDYFWVTDTNDRRHEREWLQAQLALASRAELPVVLHMREENDSESGDCAADLMAILTDWVGGMRGLESRLANAPGVVHSFSGALEAAVKAVELGFFVGVTGPVTYPSGDKRRHLVKNLPLERILTETDSPFLPPQPHRGTRNEPAFITYIADRIAQIKSLTPTQVADVTSANAARLFSWGDPV